VFKTFMRICVFYFQNMFCLHAADFELLHVVGFAGCIL